MFSRIIYHNIKRSIKINAKNNDRAIFERDPWCGQISIHEAEYAYDMCSGLDDKSKKECYLSLGVDGERVEKYLLSVKELNRLIQQTRDEPKKVSTIWDILNYPAISLIILMFAIMLDKDD